MNKLPLIVLLLLPAAGQDSAVLKLTVEAGAKDRRHAPVRAQVQVPARFGEVTRAILEDGSGKTIEAQLGVPWPEVTNPPGDTVTRQLRFILPELKAGAKLDCTLTLIRQPGPDESFVWKERPGESIDLSFGKRPVMRYMCLPFNDSSREARDLSYKVFHHLYDPSGDRLVTKGPGGKFPHHRGIYYGFNKVTYGTGKTCDVWHCTGDAHQAHDKVLAAEAGPVYGRHRLSLRWHGAAKDLFAKEERELTAYSLPGGTLVEFVSKVTPVLPPVKLDGDPQHAGFHFRADNEVSDKTAKLTYYVRPDGTGKYGETRNWPGQKDHVNLPWNAMSFMLGDTRYTAAYLDHPDNPKEARFSERDYGRFGSYFAKTLEADQALMVRYRLWLQKGEMKPDEVARLSFDFVDPPVASLK